MTKIRRILSSFPVLLGLLVTMPATATDGLDITGNSFRCLSEMTPVRGFFVDNLLGDVEATVAAATAPEGAVYPAGSVVQLVPTEVMVKREAGWSPETMDWEFFELVVSETGSAISVRGATDAVNRFGGNCLDCHQLGEPQWDMICEQDHGCEPIPFTREQIVGVQNADPRCVKAE